MNFSINHRAISLAQLVLGCAAMSSGGALVATILTRTPLWVTLLLFAIYGFLTGAFVWSRAATAERPNILRRLRIGCIAGVTATAAMDGWRLLLIVVIQFSVYSPFETFVLFGRSIAGPGLTHEAAFWVGAIYHCLNGTLFGVAYTFILGRRHWSFGIAFALVTGVG